MKPVSITPVDDPVTEDPGIHRFEPQGHPIPEHDWPAALQRHAQELGWIRLGVASVEPFASAAEQLRSWLAAGYQGEMSYLERERSRPAELLPGARSLIACAMAYPGPAAAGEPIAAYARGRDYHQVLKARLLWLAQRLANDLGRTLTARACVDTAPLLEREAASRAGFSFIGKSSLAIVPGVGTYVLLGELIVDVALPATQGALSGCGRCTRCLDACPTQAFVGPNVLDARRCISYLTIEYRGIIPRLLRTAMGTHVFGCDICQIVCPYNDTKRPVAHSPQLAPRPQPDLIALLQLSATRYRKLARGTALERATRTQLQRNAAVALGNSSAPGAVAALIGALTTTAPIVRAHVAWALGQKRADRAEALAALRAAETSETDETVHAEIVAAIAELEAPTP